MIQVCKNCGDPIYWVEIENRKSRMPINPKGQPYVVRSKTNAKYYLYFGYQPHYLTCPAREECSKNKFQYEVEVEEGGEEE